MEKLVRAVNDFRESSGMNEPDPIAELSWCTDLRVAAKVWACESLELYAGKTLDKALAISKAMVDFLNELELKPKA